MYVPDAQTELLDRPRGYLNLTLHAHLPWVVNHGTWPHGLEWLLEVAAETYLPLLRMLGRLERDGLSLRANLNLSPILMEQLAHPVFRAELPRYLERKLQAAREDEAHFRSTGEEPCELAARHWQQFFSDAIHDFEAIDRDIVGAFRRFQASGQIEILACTATHAYLPLLGTDESVRAQVRIGQQTHRQHLGSTAKGAWVPECGYRPAGLWRSPLAEEQGAAGGQLDQPFERIGIEQAIEENGLRFFFVDNHLLEDAFASPAQDGYQAHGNDAHGTRRRLHRPYLVANAQTLQPSSIAVFARDPRTSAQVWANDGGYPGDPHYLDFHKKRWPGGLRYWAVTDHRIDIAHKVQYYPTAAAERIRAHAAHFVSLVAEAVAAGTEDGAPPILTVPFDAELFGHWWFEGPLWLEAVVRELANHPHGIALTTTAAYLDNFPPTQALTLPEGSWGAAGSNQVWLNADTRWTWEHIYRAEVQTRELCSRGRWRHDPLSRRILQQLCRELLLLESSDWQFLITTGSARDYAEQRFQTHRVDFEELLELWNRAPHGLSAEQLHQLEIIERRDSIFADLDPGDWAAIRAPEDISLATQTASDR